MRSTNQFDSESFRNSRAGGSARQDAAYGDEEAAE